MKTVLSFLLAGLVASAWMFGSDNVQTLASIYMWVMGGLLIALSLFGSAVFKFSSHSGFEIPVDEDFLNKSFVKYPAFQVLVFSIAIFNCWLAFQNDFVVTSVVYGAGQIMGFTFIQFVKTKMIGE